MKRILVGSRDSKLAVMQTKLVMEAICRRSPEIEWELVTLKTTGDKILDKTLDKIGGKGLFVKELDQALLDGTIDIAVHSLKDVPMEENQNLPLIALPRRGDPRDVMVLGKGEDRREELEQIGSSSFRRQLQLKKLFPQAITTNIRGNIITRLEKLDRGEYSALILAASGLKRAGLEQRISRYFEPDEMLPAAGQGILAVQARADFDASVVKKITHFETSVAAEAERSFVRTLEGGCSSPVAAYAEIRGNEVRLTGLYYIEGTGEYRIEATHGDVNQAQKLGEMLALHMKGVYGS